jgi:hypothetical protein
MLAAPSVKQFWPEGKSTYQPSVSISMFIELHAPSEAATTIFDLKRFAVKPKICLRSPVSVLVIARNPSSSLSKLCAPHCAGDA